MKNEPRECLIKLIKEQGTNLSQDPKRCKALLLDHCGAYRREINSLINALGENIVTELLNTSKSLPQEVILNRLEKKLSDNLSMTAESARWTVETWAIALGVVNEADLESVQEVGHSNPEPNGEERNQPKETGNIFSFEVVKVNASGEIINKKTKSAKYQSLNLGSGGELELVYIPGGEFTMGSSSTEKGRNDDEGPQHQVKISPFWMGKYPVTQVQWCAMMGKNPSHFKGDKRPVEKVSWFDCVKFCQELTQKIGKDVNLPSEAQWEYACKGGNQTPFYFGETITIDLANYYGKSTYANEPPGVVRGQTTDVGMFPPNNFGLYDMHGNVWEWCLDQYQSRYQKSKVFQTRVVRGGSWGDESVHCRSTKRNSYNAGIANTYIGFRVILRCEDS